MSVENPNGVSVNEALALMVAHGRENPTHGGNCACKDRFARAARRQLTKDEREELRYLARLLVQ